MAKWALKVCRICADFTKMVRSICKLRVRVFYCNALTGLFSVTGALSNVNFVCMYICIQDFQFLAQNSDSSSLYAVGSWFFGPNLSLFCDEDVER